jgi:hypothetical protein
VANNTREWLWPMLFITAIYSALVFVTNEFVVPLQRQFFPLITSFGIVLFLPHGVRVLSAWLYGWRSIIYLLPGSIAGVAMVYGASGFEIPLIWIVPLVCVCGYAGIAITRSIYRSAATSIISKSELNWMQIILASALASLINTAGHSLILGVTGIEAFAFLVGDTLGTVVLLLVLMLAFRWWRQFNIS